MTTNAAARMDGVVIRISTVVLDANPVMAFAVDFESETGVRYIDIFGVLVHVNGMTP